MNASTTLPIPGAQDRSELEAMGIVFGENSDDLFINATLPAGWKKQATDHSMWSDLLDDKGRKRAAIFYKGAFYDRRASITLINRYSVKSVFDWGSEDVQMQVVDGDTVLFETAKLHVGVKPSNGTDEDKRKYWQAGDEMRAKVDGEARAWLDANFPEWRQPSKYWD